jgi:RNA polymerase subunit RPABC4/transcription elongation factor Spt4
MAYRIPAERVKDDEPVVPLADKVFCSRCRFRVVPTDDLRCPQCLRRSTLVEAGRPLPEEPVAVAAPFVEIVGPPPRPVLPAPVVWPDNDACPICGDRDVDASSVFLRVSRVASGFGSTTAGIIARIRTCTACRARIVRLEWSRWGALLALLLGLPLILLSLTGGPGTLLGILGVVLVVGPLAGVAHWNRALRALLDASGVTEEVADRVPWPSGLFTHEHWVLHARLPRGREAIDLTALD